jgi:hypothetical protein
MKMDDFGPRFSEEADETAASVRQVPAHVRLHNETFITHPLAKLAKRRDRIDSRLVTLVSLQAAHLEHECFSSAHLHTVNDVRDLHTDA